MPILTRWHDENNSIYIMTYLGRWTVEEYQRQFAQTTHDIEAAGHPVDLIVDMTMAGAPPLGVLNTSHQTVFQHADNLRSVTVIAVQQVTRNVVNFAQQAPFESSVPVRLTATMQEAMRGLGRSA